MKTKTKDLGPLPIEHITEYDVAAVYYAKHHKLPANMGSPGALDWINADPEAFQERVRQCAYALSMKGQTKPKPASAHTPGAFEIMAQWKSHEIQHWLDTTQSNVARALFESGAKIEAEHLDLLAACEKALGFINDLSSSNPGFLGKLVLQDYARYNEAMIELPRAIAKAGGRA
jgi:hypothetical protein